MGLLYSAYQSVIGLGAMCLAILRVLERRASGVASYAAQLGSVALLGTWFVGYFMSDECGEL